MDRLNTYLLILIAAFPLIGMRISIYLIVMFCMTTVYLSVKSKNWKNINLNLSPILFLSSYYLMALLSFIITQNIEKGLSDLETKASFIVFPLFTFLIAHKLKEEKTFNTILISFSISNVILAVYIWGKIFTIGFFKMLEADNHYNPVFRQIFSNISNIHLPYLGLLFGFSCIIFLKFLLKRDLKIVNRMLLILFSFILFGSMFFFTARMAIVVTFLAFIYYSISHLKTKTILKAAGLLVVLAISLSFLKPVKRRFEELYKTEFKMPKMNEKSNKVNFRYVIYSCSKEILEDHWVFGYGLGNVQDKLNNCYSKVDYLNYDDFITRNYNTHNQYLNVWLTYGIFGLIFFVAYLLISVNKSTRLHKSFMLMIILALITENFFEREIGVMFFSFFNTIMFFNKKQLKTKTLQS